MKHRISPIAVIASVALFFSLGGAAQASTGSYGQSQPATVFYAAHGAPFSLAQARHATAKFERRYWAGASVSQIAIGGCYWRAPRRAACAVVMSAVIIDGIAPIRIRWTDYVQRGPHGYLTVVADSLG